MRNAEPDHADDPLAGAIASGDAGTVAALLDAHPRRLHTHTAQPRPWGEELWLPLHRAALAGRSSVVALLLERGAQPDSRTRYLAGPEHGRSTALHLAAAAGHADVARLLLNAGADPEVRDAQDLAPLHLAPHDSAVADALRAAGARNDPPPPDADRDRYCDLLNRSPDPNASPGDGNPRRPLG